MGTVRLSRDARTARVRNGHPRIAAHVQRLSVVVLLLPLPACVNMSGLGGDSKYACAAPEGVACDSVSGTYANALHHKLPSQLASASLPRGPAAGLTQGIDKPADTPSPAASAPLRRLAPDDPHGSADPGAETRRPAALRSQARVLRLWTKPWEDIDGDLWDQGFVYVQVDAGRWQIDHVQQQIRDRHAPLRPPPAAVSQAAPAPSSQEASTDAWQPPQAPGDGSLQRPTPAPFSPFPSLSRPPTGLGGRPQ